MRKARKHYTAEEKVAILRRHLVDKELVSKLCDELALQPTVFYRWQKEFFENGAAAFQTNNRGRRQPEQERIARLEKKIQIKDEVLAELMAEHVALKKVLGNSNQNLDAARPTRPDRRFRAALVGEDRDPRRAFHRLARHRAQQVLFLAPPLWLCQRAQRLGSPRFLGSKSGEKQAILDFYRQYPLEGYRRLTFMMLDDIVAVSPSSVWRVLSRAGLLRKWNGKTSLGSDVFPVRYG